MACKADNIINLYSILLCYVLSFHIPNSIRNINGQIPVITFPEGRKQYIDREDVEAFIQNNKKVIQW